jgi:hypothetical protein
VRTPQDDAADGGKDELANHGTAWAEMVDEEAVGDLHSGEAEEEGACKRVQGFRPVARSRIRSRPMVTLETRKKWLAT